MRTTRGTRATHLLAACALALACAPAQADRDPGGRDLAAMAESWVSSDQSDRPRLDALVQAMLRDPQAGLAWLAQQLPAANAAPGEPRSKGVHDLCTRTVIEHMRRTRERGVFFAGQYDHLRALQPFVGDMLFGLLLDTPEWFPMTHRARLVPVLRDLQPEAPDAQRLAGVIELAENKAIEPEDLRRQLACMLWQWGKKQYAQAFLEQLQRAAADGDAEDRVQATLDLAEMHYQMREYRLSANTHRAAQALAASTKVELKPIAYYSSACVHTLSGDVERGMASLEKCAQLLASPHLDESLRLQKSLFETDPEIAVLRKDPKFQALLKLAFASPPPPSRENGR